MQNSLPAQETSSGEIQASSLKKLRSGSPLSRRLLAICLLTIIGVCLIIIALLAIVNSQMKESFLKPPEKALAPTRAAPSPAEERLEWKVYRNVACAYELEYPDNWFLSKMNPGSCGEIDTLTSYKPSEPQIKDPEFLEDKLKIEISRMTKTKPEGLSLKVWLETYEKDFPDALTEIVTEDFVEMGGGRAIEQVRSFRNDEDHILIFYYIEGEVDVYFISADFYSLENQEVIDQILGTFKFLEAAQECSPVIDPCLPESCSYDLVKCEELKVEE